MPTCDILLASYNAAKYGPALLDSLLSQTYQEFQLIVRDDGSTDNSLDLLRQYQPKFGGRMRIVQDGHPTGSAQGNFSLLLQESDADFVLFSDIDDVWLPTKTEHFIDLMQRHQSGLSPDTPLYAFTDVVPVDASLQPVSEGYWKFKQIDPEISQHLNRSLICCPILGCASGINRALAKLTTPVPAEVTGHDWWALLIASALGKVVYSAERTLLYRLHQANVSTPKRVSLTEYARAENRFEKVRRGMLRRSEQAQALLDAFGPAMTADKRRIVEGFVGLRREGFLRRRYNLLRGQYLYPDMARNLAVLIAS
ncbi:glycosyltransferase [Lichenifustis flavocetrariae]|uniref:Glycosyltransferase n=1 Tax=Lichenifustis flavocetrariae TaxID=2949735 RepID=A0AA41Z2Z1_9HYPH|nr:glycosyltransferase [Lichenifustis flavocetrariae]MCW6509563.1 glycosyltransferase [Lichenifustis flavocetrariae]